MSEDGAPLELAIQVVDDVATVVVAGEIDLATADRFDDALVRACGRDGRRAVVVDLSAVRYLDSSGFRVLHRAANRGRIAVVVPTDNPIRRAVDLAGLHALIPVLESVDEGRDAHP